MVPKYSLDESEARVGDTIRRKVGRSYAGEQATILYVADDKVVSVFPNREKTAHTTIEGGRIEGWGNDSDDFRSNWELVERAKGDKVKTVGVKFVAPPFTLKGHAPKLQLSVGCKTFELAGFTKRAAKVRRLLAHASVPDAAVTVLGESGVTVADIDGLLDWLGKELKKI